MKVAILTLPLNDNFGGVLQAYALRQVLVDKGHEVVHIEKSEVTSIVHWSSFRFYSWWYGRRMIRQFLSSNKERKLKNKKLYALHVTTREIRAFVKKNIPRLLLSDFKLLKEKEVNCLLVGSDQIWRPAYYGNIEEAYLDFAEHWDVKRIAYAPSFGVDYWEYTDSQTANCARLIKQFDAISSREEDGVSFCKERLKIDSVRAIDPTMLLNREKYDQLIGKKVKSVYRQLTTYILDDHEEKRSITNKLKLLGGFNTVELGLAGNDVKYAKELSISKWIEEFMKAEFIFTDSFHGCVFAILFHKPFVVYGNKERGISRFYNLLSLFQLEDRLVFNIDELQEVFQKTVDWANVDTILTRERNKSQNLFESVGL